ncbi:MAG: hypothetical protein JSV88_25920 [Candidatus Aminicenantes bacterium]|nr:MAG: hypothetical protein JSV88_25920 [Candidatus Aminicenantes bacterium]
MKKISFFVLLGFFITVDLIYPGKAAILTELANPYKMEADNRRLYIAEGASIFIYSLKDYSFIKRFGKQGEGPGEFKVVPNSNMGSVQFDIYPDYLIVHSIGRVSFFTKQGEFIKEMQSPSSAGYYKPLGKGNGFVGAAFSRENKSYYRTINVYDPGLKKIKELYRQPAWFNPGKNINLFTLLRGLWFDVSAQILFIEKEKNRILLFNHKGEPMDSLLPPIKPLKVTPGKKKELLHVLETSARFKAFYQRFKSSIRVPAYYPGIHSLHVGNQKIYVLSWRKKKGKSECLIYDLKKKVWDKMYIPLKEMNALMPYPFTIRNGKLYQLIEAEDTEKWELHVESIFFNHAAN